MLQTTSEDRRRTVGVPQAYRGRCTARVAIVGDRGRGPARVTISTLNIRCIGELVFIPYTDNLVKIFLWEWVYITRFALIKYPFSRTEI